MLWQNKIFFQKCVLSSKKVIPLVLLVTILDWCIVQKGTYQLVEPAMIANGEDILKEQNSRILI